MTVATVLLQEGRAVGVESDDGRRFSALRGVVLSAGALGTPQLLHRSGLGPSDGVWPLREHPCLDLAVLFNASNKTCAGRWPRPPHTPHDVGHHELLIFMNATGAISTSPDASLEFEIILAENCCNGTYCFQFTPILLRPRGVGSFRTGVGNSSSCKFVLHGDDIRKFNHLFHIFRRALMAARSAFSLGTGPHVPHRSVLLDPLLMPSSLFYPDLFEAQLRARIRTYNHPHGTCPMGEVVDDRLHFLGTSNLIVADASVVSSASGHTDSAAQLVGYMAAAFAKLPKTE